MKTDSSKFVPTKLHSLTHSQARARCFICVSTLAIFVMTKYFFLIGTFVNPSRWMCVCVYERRQIILKRHFNYFVFTFAGEFYTFLFVLNGITHTHTHTKFNRNFSTLPIRSGSGDLCICLCENDKQIVYYMYCVEPGWCSFYLLHRIVF